MRESNFKGPQRGRRLSVTSGDPSGRYVSFRMPRGKVKDIAIDATLRVYATRGGSGGVGIQDVREKVRERKTSFLILFLVDSSGSIGVERRMGVVKGTVLSLLKDSYLKRDRVGLVTFRDRGAEVVLPFTNNPELGKKAVENLPTGGRTPLAHGLYLAYKLIKSELDKDKSKIPVLVVLSDGKANVSAWGGDPLDEAELVAKMIRKLGVRSIFVDTEVDHLAFGYGFELARSLGAKYIRMEEIKEGGFIELVREALWR